MLCSVRFIIKNLTFAFWTILQALVGRRAKSVGNENNFYYVLMTLIMSSDKWKIFSIRYTYSSYRAQCNFRPIYPVLPYSF